ncbi:MAG: DUF4132 domain-containing protein [bacterium]|nr:DUF4132 domain-containing protein [bacterium]MCM1375514.1 DUF4132 domain-containing protein [Muribaculum sp.]
MLRAQHGQGNKMMEALEGLELTDRELELAEKYLKGEVEEEALAEVTVRDMSGIPQSKALAVTKLLGSLMKKKQYEETKRLFNLLYALGSHTCFPCLYQEFLIFMELIRNVEARKFRIESYKWLAVYVRYTYSTYAMWDRYNPYFLSGSMLNTLKKHADGLPETVRRALREYESGYIGERLILLTLLFYMNYDSIPSAEAFHKEYVSSADGSGVLGGIRKLLGGREPSEDIAWMGEYEKLLKEAICQSVLPGAPGRVIDIALFLLAGGCAFVNYRLSERLYDVVKLCCITEPKLMLSAFCALDARGEISRTGGDWDDLFEIPTEELLKWVVEQMKFDSRSSATGISAEDGEKILRTQLRKHRAAFLECYRNAEIKAAGKMAQIMKEEDPALYREEVLQKAEEQKQKLIRLMSTKGDFTQNTFPKECVDYLEGVSDLQALYAVRDQLPIPYYGAYMYGGRGVLEEYVRTYGDEEFYARCMAVMALLEDSYFFNGFSAPLSQKEEFQKELRHIFQGLTRAGVGLADQLRVVGIMVDIYETNKKEAITQGCISVFQQYLAQRTQETVSALSEAGAYGRTFALLVYGSEADLQMMEENREVCQAGLAEFAKGRDAWRDQILAYSQDSSKQVREELERILTERPGWREQVTDLLSSKKAQERELGIRVLAKWNAPQDRQALEELYGREKSAKIRTLLDTVLGHEAAGESVGENSDGQGNPALARDNLVKNLHKGGKKRTLAWAYETPFSPVRTKGGEQATEEYLQALLLCYSSMTKPGVSKDAALLAQELEPQELAVYMGELFDKWMSAGAEAKKRWVLYAASIHGGSDIVQRLHRQIQEWPQNARGAIAADAVQALALSPQPQALLIVDGIARKFKFKQIKTAAGQALEFAASQLGLTREQLEDKIVPSLGFDEHMERRFDYGSRSFTVTITPALEVEVFDESGKKLKNMPAPGAKDDAEQAAAAYAEFKDMKKQMKATVTSQKQRLELALSSERLWTVSAWQELFVRNPIMHQFAIGLIWGVYEDHKLTRSFRYMEDGSFNTEDEEEYILPESQTGQIGLVHPIELTKESLEAWRQQLEDYEITQPIEQLSRTVYYITTEEQESKSLERFGGMVLNDLSLGGKLTALGWYRGAVEDGGCFDNYYREDASVGLRAELHFSGSFVGSGSMGGEEITVYDVRFYEADQEERGAYFFGKDDERLALKDIPLRYFSEIVWQITKATASSKERIENWRE